jgi:hypothetical protein
MSRSGDGIDCVYFSHNHATTLIAALILNDEQTQWRYVQAGVALA